MCCGLCERVFSSLILFHFNGALLTVYAFVAVACSVSSFVAGTSTSIRRHTNTHTHTYINELTKKEERNNNKTFINLVDLDHSAYTQR